MDNQKLKFLKMIQDESNCSQFWSSYEDLIDKFKPLNLSKHYLDFCPNPEMNDILSNVVLDKKYLFNQYTSDFGHKRLANVLCKIYSKILQRDLSSESNMLISMGMTQGLFATISGFIEKYDEVILITPIYHCCKPIILMYGGIVHTCPLKYVHESSSTNWILDEEKLESLFNDKTKLIIISNPNYILGRVYTKPELEFIGNLCKKWNVLCLIDESLQSTVYGSHKHTHMATLPGMWERTLTIAANGVSFGRTGWRIAWIYGPENLIYNTKVVHQLSFSSFTPVQETLARVIEKHGLDYILINNLQENRDLLLKCFEKFGFRCIIPESGYYVIIEIKLDETGQNLEEYRDCIAKLLISKFGILGLPLINYGRTESTMLVGFSFAQRIDAIKSAVKQFEENNV